MQESVQCFITEKPVLFLFLLIAFLRRCVASVALPFSFLFIAFIIWILSSFCFTAVVELCMHAKEERYEGEEMRRRGEKEEKDETLFSFFFYLPSFAFSLLRIFRPSHFTMHALCHHRSATEATQFLKDKKQ